MKWHLIVSVILIVTSRCTALISEWLPYNRSHLGVVDLPSLDPASLPAHCHDFKAACALETEHKYESAFSMYEERYAACGDYGWTLNGDSHGLDARVIFKTTPCGTQSVIKMTRYREPLKHIEKECGVLKLLAADNGPTGACHKCFPDFYYYSPTTKACYSEYLGHSEGRHELFLGAGTNHANGVQHVKSLLMQAVRIIEVLRSHNIEHRDFTIRNVKIKKTGMLNEKRSEGYRLKLLDFGASAPLDQAEENLHNKRMAPAGNMGRSDLYAITCSIGIEIYSKFRSCRRITWRYTGPSSPESLFDALALIMAENANVTTVPDFHRIRNVIEGVTHA